MLSSYELGPSSEWTAPFHEEGMAIREMRKLTSRLFRCGHEEEGILEDMQVMEQLSRLKVQFTQTA